MAEEKAKERIILRGNQQTTISIGFSRGGKVKLEHGDKIAVASSAGTIISARFNPGSGLVDVVPIDGALGQSDVSVTITLADGSVLPPQAVEYTVVHPDAEAVVLAPGTISDKKTVIRVPLPNAEPHVVALPDARKSAPSQEKTPDPKGAKTTGL